LHFSIRDKKKELNIPTELFVYPMPDWFCFVKSLASERSPKKHSAFGVRQETA